MKKGLSITLLLSTTLLNIFARQPFNYKVWAIHIADSEMKHNPKLWMADFVKEPN